LFAVASLPTHLLITGSLLAGLALAFVLFFFFPALAFWFRLQAIQRKLKAFTANSAPAAFDQLFANDRKLAHLWREYADTLHQQSSVHDSQQQLANSHSTRSTVRSTMPAETFFNPQQVVDSRLRTEFFKHLPGIFTGLGIIGTFSGLIDGLGQFQVSENATAVRTSLEALMHAVGEAFLISAAAITAAMTVTFLEKLLLASLYRCVEEIAHRIDSNFDAGAGEEYLSRLVDASEASASQTRTLKDALVKELGDILREVAAAQLASNQQLTTQLIQHIDQAAKQQLAAANQDQQGLGNAIAASIENSLKSPLASIASAVKTASAEQSSSAVTLLNEVMTNFSERLNTLFGGQISGINTLNQQTTDSMQHTVTALNTLVSNLEASGKRTTDDMASQMTSTSAAMQQTLQDTLGAMGAQMTSILNTLGESQRSVFEEDRARKAQLDASTSQMVDTMSSSVESAIKELAVASQVMAKSVNVLSATTTASIDKLNVGADRIDAAANLFSEAGDRVAKIMNLVTVSNSKMLELTGQLTSSTTAMQELLRDYQVQRQVVAGMVGELRALTDQARKEALLTSDVLQRIETSTAKLGAAQQAADMYLDGVNQVLADSSAAFRESVVSTLDKVNHEFHAKLSSAVGLLATAVQELEVTLGSFTPRP
jgi:uncharacterized protein with GYD domain